MIRNELSSLVLHVEMIESHILDNAEVRESCWGGNDARA